MSLTGLVNAIRQQEVNLRIKENELIFEIIQIDGEETAEAAKEYFSHEKHVYDFEGYLYKLKKLINLLREGMQPDKAFIFAESCIDTDTIIKIHRKEKQNEQMYLLRKTGKRS